ncbi:DUF2642 domain-containing protein [Bacillus sp. FSL K6-3431]|uniref:DUF2642 domain-containing protein n=1 Tax=Bacillus sp. FSL K6-3431 TaxID=2921500 RepID=UPI0030F5F1ED
MNKIIQNLIREVVQIEVSGKKFINGTIVDIGNDIIVLFNGTDFVYIPLVHIQNLRVDQKNEDEIKSPTESPSIVSEENKDELSLRKVLTQSKGMFVEIYVTSNQPLHGYITSIMNNYFVFHSPIYKTMYITLHHLKWLIPYSNNQRPYDLDNRNFPIQPTNVSLARTFEVQVKKFENEVVVFNIGENNNHIGKINNVEEQIIEIQTARTHPVYLNLHHIKTLHQV